MKAAPGDNASGLRRRLCDSVVPAPWSLEPGWLSQKSEGQGASGRLGASSVGTGLMHNMSLCFVWSTRAGSGWCDQDGEAWLCHRLRGAGESVRTCHPSLLWDWTQMLGKPEVTRPGDGAGRTPLSLVTVGALVMKTIPLPLRLFGSWVTIFKIVRYP